MFLCTAFPNMFSMSDDLKYERTESERERERGSSIRRDFRKSDDLIYGRRERGSSIRTGLRVDTLK